MNREYMKYENVTIHMALKHSAASIFKIDKVELNFYGAVQTLHYPKKKTEMCDNSNGVLQCI